MRQQVIFEDLGIQSYQPTWDYQEQRLKEAVALKTEARTQNKEASEAKTQHRFILVEHPPGFRFVFHEIMPFLNAGFFILIFYDFPASHVVGKIIFKNGVSVLDVCDRKIKNHEKRV